MHPESGHRYNGDLVRRCNGHPEGPSLKLSMVLVDSFFYEKKSAAPMEKPELAEWNVNELLTHIGFGTLDKEALMSCLNEPRSRYSIQYLGHVWVVFWQGFIHTEYDVQMDPAPLRVRKHRRNHVLEQIEATVGELSQSCISRKS